ncbi:MAG TPA: sugar ABC transporter substrate-binding protein [Ktedonobacteraceae bacterium]|nr:sugar ABC transporter substrate-binding protein [Ktedonobacteraceae bacterium]
MISESAYLPCSADVAITIVYQTSQLCLIAHSVNVFRNPYQVEFSVEVEKGHIMLLRRPVTSIFPIFLILSSLFIAACGSSPSASSGGSGTQPVTLNWFMWSGSPQEVQAWQYDASLVTKKYPWIHINFQTASWTDYWTKLESEAATGNLPDIVSLQSERTAGFADSFLPLDTYVKQDKFDVSAFDQGIIKGLTYQGSLRALPYDFGPQVVYYNKALFQKYNVPVPSANWTYADFLQDAQKLTHGNDYGFLATSYPDYWLPFAMSNGAQYLSSNGQQVDLTNPQLVNAFQEYAKLTYQYHVSPPINVQQASNTEFLWEAGNIAMYVDGPWDLINNKQTAKFPFGIVPLPSGSKGSISLVAGSGFGISKTSQHPDDAWKAISVLTSADAQQYLSGQGRSFAARTAQQQYWYKNAVEGSQQALDAANSTALPELTTSNWNQVSTLITQYGLNALNGQETAAKALSQVQEQINNS